MAAVSAGVNRPALEDQANNRRRQHEQPERGRHIQHQHHAQPARHRLAQPGIVAARRVARNRRQRSGGNRNAEQADRHVHQPERVVEPRHRASSQPGRKPAVDEQIDLHRREPGNAGHHQAPDLAQPWIVDVEDRLIPKSLAA